jgi:hypothetical protein
MKLNKLLVIGILLLSSTSAKAGFFDSTMPAVNKADVEQAQKTKQLNEEANRQLGMPAIINFQEKRMMKQLYELRDTEISTQTYIVNSMKGCLVYLGQSVGYGLPYATQYSNPQRIMAYNETPEHGNTLIPQSEPNGLFMPVDAHGTWVMMFNPDKKEVEPVYMEPDVIVSPFRLTNQECKGQ